MIWDWPRLCSALLIKAALGEVILIEAEVMAEFVQISCVNFFELDFLVGFREVPEVFQIQNDLRRHG